MVKQGVAVLAVVPRQVPCYFSISTSATYESSFDFSIKPTLSLTDNNAVIPSLQECLKEDEFTEKSAVPRNWYDN